MARLLEVEVARRLIAERLPIAVAERVALAMARDRVLAEPLVARTDSPPYDKSLVDGFAIATSTLAELPVSLKIVETIYAGNQPTRAVTAGTASRIMTGAPLPAGADAVVMVEHTVPSADGKEVVIHAARIVPHQHILKQADSIRAGSTILPAHHRIRAVDLGLAAEAGEIELPCFRRPVVGLLQTGDEVVPASQSELGAAQIRNSNGPLLRALAEPLADTIIDGGVVVDDAIALRKAISQLASADVVMISGGVSQGERDLVPRVLQELGADCVFHRVALKPGKPLWFGVWADVDRTRLIFGLPGNPVSGLVGFLLFAAPALKAWAGHREAWQRTARRACLAESFTTRGELTTFWPARLELMADEILPRAVPLSWRGSADQFALGRADGFLEFAPGERTFEAGEIVPLWYLP